MSHAGRDRRGRSFLAAPLTNDEITELHERYLRGFWAEEFQDGEGPLARHQKPDTPRRNKIQAYVQRVLNPTGNLSLMSDVSQAVSSTYSGYIHASAVQILDMYGGDPPHFHIEGMQGTPRMNDHIYDAWNYFSEASSPESLSLGPLVISHYRELSVSTTTNFWINLVGDPIECEGLQVLNHKSESPLHSFVRSRFGADDLRRTTNARNGSDALSGDRPLSGTGTSLTAFRR